ncbi:ion transporter [Temperatibacter marinus]|uniref:Ion transporter n=1 Tax=Temperatibacter marinus TaxID=1456591 RepID=A0AA52HA71_9PROT|nr:ion transporter [Temperatibacter marinus]WND03322.1 ion transporter [Temperatibacter marinus]
MLIMRGGGQSSGDQKPEEDSTLKTVKTIVDGKYFQGTIIGVILINAIILGLQTVRGFSAETQETLHILDQICLWIFVLELIIKLWVFRLSFFKTGGNIFDALIVGISFLPAQGGLTILRTFRIFRVLRLVTAIRSMRIVVTGLLAAIPGAASVGGLLLILFYIASVMATTLFGDRFVDWFGSIGASMYTLFQIMTLESWSMGIARPVISEYPYAWAFFIPFIILSTFTVLNLFIGIMVDAIGVAKEEDSHHQEKEDIIRHETHDIILEMSERLKSMEGELKALKEVNQPLLDEQKD